MTGDLHLDAGSLCGLRAERDALGNVLGHHPPEPDQPGARNGIRIGNRANRLGIRKNGVFRVGKPNPEPLLALINRVHAHRHGQLGTERTRRDRQNSAPGLVVNSCQRRTVFRGIANTDEGAARGVQTHLEGDRAITLRPCRVQDAESPQGMFIVVRDDKLCARHRDGRRIGSRP